MVTGVKIEILTCGNKIKNVQAFKYLGSIFRKTRGINNGNVKKDI